MQYLGGKTRLAKHILRLVTELRGNRNKYIEPFVGGASVYSAVAPTFELAACGDVMPDLVMCWQAAASGWVPPEVVTEQEYQLAKRSEPSALRGFIGFGCSFGAKWFGGYARSGPNRNHAAESSRAVVKKAKAMRADRVFLRSFLDWDHCVDSTSVVYCDPPYAGTEPYGATKPFDHASFWETAANWSSRGALVLVSEYVAPYPWGVILEKVHIRQLGKIGDRSGTTERIFAYPNGLNPSPAGNDPSPSSP